MKTFAALLGVAHTLSSAAAGQAPKAFEAVAIRRNMSGSLNTNIQTAPGGRLTITNASLKTLIRNAYGILSFQLTGGPNWLDTEMYDVEATTGSAAEISRDELKPLLQNLLAERFHLAVHRETREGDVYALLLDKGGPKFKENPGPQKDSMNTNKGSGRARMTGTAASMPILTSNLANQLGRFAVDKTGLPGSYDFTFEWDPDQTPDSKLPSIFTALREQLDLKLETQKGAVEVLVVDHAEHATEN